MATIKGQNIRLFVEDDQGVERCLCASTTCTLHISADLEESTTKDSTGDWKEQEATSKSWDVSADMNFVLDATETALLGVDIAKMVGKKVKIRTKITEGAKNRVASAGLYEGYAIINDWNLQAPNKQNATVSMQAQGTGELAITSDSPSE
ncbi:MAG: phage major tail protein, TP901-1 family [Paludibacteraceae bacterium]|nr:phage major tail protein, TP901-1 family [Paludibacteraceae bacterium]